MKKLTLNFVLIIFTAGLFFSCEFDKYVPPKVVFKTGADYTSADKTVALGESVTVGITADKVEDDLKTYNISYAFDGASGTTTKETFTLSGSETSHYEKDYIFAARNQAGSEIWYFVVTDKDGNITKLSIKLTVQ